MSGDLHFIVISVAATQSPIVFIGTGEHLHDLDRFEARPFVRKMLGMGDLSDFVEKVQDLKLDQNKTLMKNLESGNVRVRNFHLLYAHYNSSPL
jgi:signal recognition particle subunit SRP54